MVLFQENMKLHVMVSNVLLGCFLLLLIPSYSTANRRPNFVIIVADDLGIGDVGCFGNKTIQTPNIDSIAQRGIKLNHNIAAESMCTPSRAALLTGRYAARSGYAASAGEIRVTAFTSASGGLSSEETTFAKELQDKGYINGYFGKWHLGIHCNNVTDFCHHPLKHGFNSYFGLPLTTVEECGKYYYGFGDVFNPPAIPVPRSDKFLPLVVATIIGFLTIPLPMKKVLFLLVSLYFTFWVCRLLPFLIFRQLNCFVMKNYDVVEQPVQLETFADKLTHEVETFLESNKDQPFLALVAYHNVHVALEANERFQGKSRHGRYGDNVEEMDWSVGRILRKLKELNIENDTLVYFTSDHGPALYMNINGELLGGSNGEYKGGKGSSWEGGIRVPTVAMLPGVIPKNSVYNEPTSLLDVFPTILSLAGVFPSTDQILDGKDITNVLSGKTNMNTERFLYHYCGTEIQAVTYSPTGTESIWKMHFQVPKFDAGLEYCIHNACPCFGSGIEILQEPLLYDLDKYPNESFPVKHGSALYNKIHKIVSVAVNEHSKSLEPVESQLSHARNSMSLSLQLCCNFPFCSC